MLDAIAHFHKHGFAHRDLKPDNIIVDLKDDNSISKLMIIDFNKAARVE